MIHQNDFDQEKKDLANSSPKLAKLALSINHAFAQNPLLAPAPSTVYVFNQWCIMGLEPPILINTYFI